MRFEITLGNLIEQLKEDFKIINKKNELKIDNFSTVENADKNSIVFIESEDFRTKVKHKNVGLIITNTEIPNDSTQVVVDNPRQLFFRLIKTFQDKIDRKGISPKADIGNNCNIADSAYIGPFVIIKENVTIEDNVVVEGNCYIGSDTIIKKNTVIKPLVSIYKDIEIGRNCLIHSGVVIGSDGYGYDDSNNKLTKIPQIGSVKIEDNVEIGANCTIDRATLGKTLIENNVKIDNLVQVAHNVVIKENTRIAAQTGIAGSSQIGKWVVIAGQVGIGDHVEIADNVVLTAQSGAPGDIKESGVYSGTPVRKMKKQYRIMAYQQKLETMWKKLKKMEKKIKNYEKNNKEKS